MASGGMGGMHVDEADVDNFSPGSGGGGGGGGGGHHRKRSLSESRDPSSGFSGGAGGGRLRSRSMSPAGLRSPIKRRPPVDNNFENNNSNGNNPAGNGAAVGEESRRLNLGQPPEMSGLEPVGAFADLIMDEPTTGAAVAVTNGREMKVNGGISDGDGEKEEGLMDDEDGLDADPELVKDFRLQALKAIKTPGKSKSIFR